MQSVVAFNSSIEGLPSWKKTSKKKQEGVLEERQQAQVDKDMSRMSASPWDVTARPVQT